MRQYSSFDEIDRDLVLLKLQKEVDKERVILSYNNTKESLKPLALLKGAGETLLKSAIVVKGASKLLGLISSK